MTISTKTRQRLTPATAPAAILCEAGGKPATWFAPGALVEQSTEEDKKKRPNKKNKEFAIGTERNVGKEKREKGQGENGGTSFCVRRGCETLLRVPH